MTRSPHRILTATFAEPVWTQPKPHRWEPNDPTAGTVAGNNTLDSQIARARREMGEDRWNQLQAEWSAKP